ncbi:MAG: DUF3501 family protein [Acidobacteriia bacterium]|nr:DUF3501 family protein [Terriglobia bacterium]
MKKLTVDDVRNLYEYEKIRDEFRRHIIALKQHRRLPVGDKVSLVFENRETVKFQVQEMIRAERMVDERRIQDEIDVYNQILPDADELSATLFIEITTPSDIKPELDRFQGLDQGDCVFFEMGGLARVFGRFEEGHSKEDRISAVQYVRFPFTREEQSWFRDPTVPVALVIDHPNYAARTSLTAEQREALARDFEGASVGVG